MILEVPWTDLNDLSLWMVNHERDRIEFIKFFHENLSDLTQFNDYMSDPNDYMSDPNDYMSDTNNQPNLHNLKRLVDDQLIKANFLNNGTVDNEKKLRK